jgi:hypothetical protein
MLNLETRRPSSARYRVDATAALVGQENLRSLGLRPVASRSADTRPSRQATYQQRKPEYHTQEPEYETEEDEERQTRSVVPQRRPLPPDHQPEPRRRWQTVSPQEQVAPSRHVSSPHKRQWWLLPIGAALTLIGFFAALLWLTLVGLLLFIGTALWLWWSRPQPKPARAPKGHRHPLFYIGATALVIVALLSLLSFVGTAGASWYVTHISDPSSYGPTHGSVLSMALGGGDSVENPSTLIGMNDHGQVLLLKIVPGHPEKSLVFAGPDLRTRNFPDPQAAVVALALAGPQQVQVTIYSDQFSLPFVRDHASFLLVSDGNGQLKQAA